MPYLQCKCVPFKGLAPSAPSDCCGWGPALLSSAAMPLCGRGGAIVLGPRIMVSLLQSDPLYLLDRVVGGFFPLPALIRPPPSLPHPR